MAENKKSVLFICTHNSARSQIAEGLVNNLYSDRFKAYSAGLEKTIVNPYAIKIMKEINIDLSGQSSKKIDRFLGQKFDYVVTVCDNARENCPFFPGAYKYLHAGFEDPSQATGSEEDVLEKFRATRDRIKNWIEERLPLD